MSLYELVTSGEVSCTPARIASWFSSLFDSVLALALLDHVEWVYLVEIECIFDGGVDCKSH